MKPPLKYDLRLFAVAIIIWGYAFSWIFAKGFWTAIADTRYITPAMLKGFYGTTTVIMCVISLSAGAIHGITMISAKKRKNRCPGILSHLSVLALLWIGLGSAIIIIERPFPYLEKPHPINEGVEQAGPAYPPQGVGSADP